MGIAISKQPTMKIFCGQIISPDEVLKDTVITIEDGKIAGLGPNDGSPVDVYASDRIAVPGFIDIHIHGGAGHEVMDGTPEAIRAISSHLASNGVASWLPSVLSSPWPQAKKTVAAIAEVMRMGSGGAEVLGAHLEGPFLNPARAGAMATDCLRLPSLEEIQRELGDAFCAVRYVALAPELPGALELIRDLCAAGIKVSIGHTDATYEQAQAAFDAGATGLTHTYNAMRPLHHREPGVLAAALLDNRVTAELIWDNFHVHQAAARIVVKAKGPDRVALISDAVSAAGLGDGDYMLGGQKIIVENGLAKLTNGTIAGSAITLDEVVRNAAEYFSLQEAIKMATTAPARAIGAEDRKGRIALGSDADIVLLNNDLSIDCTFLKGSRLSQ